MRIALAQINPTLADFQNNKDKILHFIEQAQQRRCKMVVFPECALFGYHPYDLLEREKLVVEQEKIIGQIAKKIPKDMAVILGMITRTGLKRGRPYYNSAVLLIQGKKPRFFHKTLLPTGDVFDEARFIEQGDMTKNYFKWKGKDFFLTICEDIWAWPDRKGHSPYQINPIQKVPKKKVDLVINLSASPYYAGKMKYREEMVAQTAKYFSAPMMYVNLIGAQDEVIFDGSSFVLDKKGQKKLSCQSFEEDINVLDLETLEPWSRTAQVPLNEEIRRALVLGIRDFALKCGLKKLHLGLSGGIDSALVAALAVDALGPSAVTAFALPGPFNAKESLQLASQLAKNLGIHFSEIEIGGLYEETKKIFEKALDVREFGVVHENAQTRLRGLLLMAYANKENSLLLTTSNKTEYACGYATLYGDMCGGLAPIGDLTKEQVYDLVRHYNLQKEIIPGQIISRAPSAELRPNQKDQDSLPAYDELDKSVVNLVENYGAARSQTDKWLLPILMQTEFKRWQAPPVLKVSKHSFGRGRRFPIAHRAKEL